jgi:hypothetical protein
MLNSSSATSTDRRCRSRNAANAVVNWQNANHVGDMVGFECWMGLVQLGWRGGRRHSWYRVAVRFWEFRRFAMDTLRTKVSGSFD